MVIYPEKNALGGLPNRFWLENGYNTDGQKMWVSAPRYQERETPRGRGGPGRLVYTNSILEGVFKK